MKVHHNADFDYLKDLICAFRNNIPEEELRNRFLSLTEYHGYQTIHLEIENEPVAFAGYRITETLLFGKHLFIDDLFTVEHKRNEGLAQHILKIIKAYAESVDCLSIQLDSGLSRKNTHLFYENNDFTKTAFHFYKKINK